MSSREEREATRVFFEPSLSPEEILTADYVAIEADAAERLAKEDRLRKRGGADNNDNNNVSSEIKVVDDLTSKRALGDPLAWTQALSGDFLDLITAGVMAYYVMEAPYTKVEESFNLQATHDLIVLSPANVAYFDHLTYPGVVPRTFLGPLWLYVSSHLIISILTQSGSNEDLSIDHYQFMIRMVLAAYVCHSLRSIRQSVQRVFGHPVSILFCLFNICEFHLMFWGSRTLPNILALVFMNWTVSCWIDGFKELTAEEKEAIVKARKASALQGPPTLAERGKKVKKPKNLEPFVDSISMGLLSLGSFVTIVFRLEIAAFFVPIVVSEIRQKRFSLYKASVIVFFIGICSIALSIAADAYFWEMPQWMWAESQVFNFNIVKNKSVEYGVAPFYAYFTSLLPRIAPLTYPLAIYAGCVDTRARRLIIPAAIFVFVMSFIPHKEWRFVIYVVPVFNVAAAIAVTRLHRLSSTLFYPNGKGTIIRTLVPRLIANLCIFAIMASCVASYVFLNISTLNYPGGFAMKHLHKAAWPSQRTVADSGFPFVHIDAYTASNGVSRYLEVGRRAGWVYSKYEHHNSPEDYATNYTHLLTSTPTFHNKDEWLLITAINGLESAKLQKDRLADWVVEAFNNVSTNTLKWDPRRLWMGVRLPIDVEVSPKVYILEKKGYRRT